MPSTSPRHCATPSTAPPLTSRSRKANLGRDLPALRDLLSLVRARLGDDGDPVPARALGSAQGDGVDVAAVERARVLGLACLCRRGLRGARAASAERRARRGQAYEHVGYAGAL